MKIPRREALTTAAVLFCALPGMRAATEPASVRERGALSFRDENDWWGKWSDKYYTNGSRLAWTTPEIFPDSAPGGTLRATVSITHEMYSAKDGRTKTPSPDDHRYAGLAYLGLGLSRETANHLDCLQLDLGVAGPSAKGERVQQNWHHFMGADTLNGWDTQIDDRAIVNVTLERRWRIAWAEAADGLGGDLVPRVGALLGTMRTEAVAGAQLRFGKNLPRDFGQTSLRHSAAYAKPREEGAGAALYGFLDAQAELVAHNVALDGGERAAVAQLTAGVAFEAGRWQVQLLQGVRTEEFRGQDHAFAFGALTVNATF